MPKKKCRKKVLHQGDFTLNDAANSIKPVLRIKKAPAIEPVLLESWDEIADNDLDIVEEIDANDGTKKLVYRERRNHTKSDQENSSDSMGNVYPEILWYFISQYIKPEDVGKFALISKTCYAITKQERFWKMLYNRYAKHNRKLPDRLRLEKSYKSYGIKQRTIRALYHTYEVFLKRVTKEAAQDSKPHDLVKRRCIGNWYWKGLSHWNMFFKFKKIYPLQTIETEYDILEELSRVDANPDEDCQVLQIHCLDFQDVPPLMGMMLSSVRVLLSKNFEFHRVHLGFNSGFHSISKNILPECSVVINSAIKILVYNWWHPMYPHFDNKSPLNVKDDVPVTLLKKDFFHTCDSKDCCPSEK